MTAAAPGGSGAAGPPLLVRERWPRLDDGATTLLLVPVGAVEQHGPHLPLGTDGIVAGAVARAVAERLVARGRRVSVAPAVAYGASGEHEDFPGTVSIGHEALHLLLVELVRSACRWAEGVILVNGHGGNVPTLVRAAGQLRAEGRAVAWTSCGVPDADAHAGRTETSMMRHLAPWTVRGDLAVAGVTDPVTTLMPRLAAEGVRAVSPTGVLGDPAGSSAEEGARVLGRVVDRVVAELTDVDVDDDGRLHAPVGTTTG